MERSNAARRELAEAERTDAGDGTRRRASDDKWERRALLTRREQYQVRREFGLFRNRTKPQESRTLTWSTRMNSVHCSAL